MLKASEDQTKISDVSRTKNNAKDVNLPIHLVSMGRYLPLTTISNADIEQETGTPATLIEKRLGVQTRRVCDKSKGETSSFMGARAIEDACKNAQMPLSSINLIINASGTPERLIPDGAALMNKHLGEEAAGIPCFTVHATCLSFVVGMQMAASLLATGIYQNIVVVSSENPAPDYFEKSDWHSYPLFGALAVAAIFTVPSPESKSAVTRFYMETFGDYIDLCTCKVGSSHCPSDPELDYYFKMDGPNILAFVHNNLAPVFEKIQAGLSGGKMGDIDYIIPHQASGNGNKLLERVFGKEKIMTSALAEYGNSIGASIPNALFEAISAEKIKRGDSVLLVGTGAGISVAGLKFIY